MPAIDVDPSRAAWLRVRDMLHEMLDLPDDWDGMGAEAPRRDVVADAIDVLDTARHREDWPPPTRVVATPDGSIIIEWQTILRCLEIEIEHPGQVEWMLSFHDGGSDRGSGLPDLARMLGGERTF